MRGLIRHFLALNNPFRSRFRVSLKHQSQLYGFISNFTLSSCSCFYLGKDPVGFATALSFSRTLRSPILGTQIHGHIVKLGFTNDVFTLNNLIKFYSKGGVLSDGFRVFDEMPQRNVVSWTLVISGAIQSGEVELGLEFYLLMRRDGLMPNEFALGSVMKVCANVEASDFGMNIHCFALKIGMERNPCVGTSILCFYAKLGDIEAAESIFKGIDNVDVGCWNAMVGGFVQCGYSSEAISTVSLMRFKGVVIDKYTIISALQGCSIVGDLTFGRQIHGLIIKTEVKYSTSVMNALVDMYFKNGAMNCALKIFRRMHERDVVTWNTVFGSFSQYENPREVVSLFYDFMLTGIRPNHITFSVLFRECGELHDIDLGLQFYCLSVHIGFFDDVNITSPLISMFSRCGAMDMACLVFDSRDFKNIIIWNELISGYNLNHCDIEAMKTFSNLLQLGVDANEYTYSNVLQTCCQSGYQEISRQIHGVVVKSGFASHGYVCSSLIKCYIKFGQLDDSLEFFNGVENLDIASWGSMISTLVHQGYKYEAIRFLNSMIEAGERPDEFILGSILNSCAGISVYSQTNSVYPFVIKMGFERDVFVASATLDAYAKCGDIKSARKVFNQSFKYNDTVIYNAMIMGYAHHGLVAEAMDIFDRMKLANLQPSQATFVSVLSACGHMGLVDQGCLLFESMNLEYGMKPSPDTYGCLVDMLSRNGYLEDAKLIMEMMPYPVWPAILRSLLSGCRIYGNRELAEWAAKKLLQLVPENDAAHVLLFKVYSELGSWEDSAKVRKGVTERSLKKGPGHSWIEA